MIADINLLPKREKRTNGDRIYLLSVFAVFLLVAAYIAYSYMSSKQELVQAEAYKETVDAEIAVLQMQVEEQTANQAISRVAAVNFIEYVSYDVTPIMEDVTKRLPDHAYLRELNFSESSVILQTEFEDKTQVNLFLSSLQSSPLYVDATIQEINSFSRNSSDTTDNTSMFEELPMYSVAFTLVIDPNKIRVQEVVR